MFLVDAGTSYIKLLNINSKKFSIIPITEKEKIEKYSIPFCTGHNSCFFLNSVKINELVALAEGAKTNINKDTFRILDIGSRDMKIINYKNGEFESCDWNSTCGAMIGFTIDIMMKYFNKKIDDIPKNVSNTLDITCGLLGLTKFFDKISTGTSIEAGISALIKGLAKFAWQFTGKSTSIYLSGGLSENQIFINYFNELVPDLKVLGRYVLLEGLEQIMKKKRSI